MHDPSKAKHTPFQILLALSENGTKGYQHTFANQQLIQRLRDMATDVSLSQVPSRIQYPLLTPVFLTQSLTDPKVKRKLIAVFYSWYKDYAVSPFDSSLCAAY